MGNLSEKADLEYHAKSLDLQSRRMVLVPVNDNTDYMRAEGEKHWSLLVIHIAEDHSSCRFVHHDSVSSGLNHTAAVKYANALKQVLPKAPPVIEADTPKQLNGSNCGLCVLALSKAICTWWIKRERPGKSNCWVEKINLKDHWAHFCRSEEEIEAEFDGRNASSCPCYSYCCCSYLATATTTAPDLATTKSTLDLSTDPAAPLKLKCKVKGRLVELFCKDLSCLEDGRCLVDSIIDFVYAHISLTFDSKEDLFWCHQSMPF
ncbi:hypothetical protein SEVIR_8G058600v4 [Setaria viridis]